MPAIHGSLTDQEFDDFGAIAKAKGISRNELCTALARDEIRKNTEAVTPRE